MLIILEGPDGAGKTTLAEALHDTMSFWTDDTVECRHAGPPVKHPLHEYETPLYGYRPGRRHHVICDRWHIGELIYPAVFGRTTTYDAAMHRHVEMFLRSRGALLVHVTSEVELVTEKFKSRGDTHVLPSMVPDLIEAYRHETSRSSLPTLHVDPLFHGTARTASVVIQHAERIEHDATPLNDYVTYVGPPDPTMLLVGTTLAAGPPASGNAPAFVPFRGTSGHYLLSALDASAPAGRGRPGRIALVNAYDVDPINDLIRTTLRRHQPDVVALGINAAGRLRELGITHRPVSHPQYVRRFHKHDHAAYATHILDGVAPYWYKSRG